MYEYECNECGYCWLDDGYSSCPMCGNTEDIIREDYVIPQPETLRKAESEDLK